MRGRACAVWVSAALGIAGCSSDVGDSTSTAEALTAGRVCTTIRTPPAELNLAPFYRKYCDARGIPVSAAAVVPDEAVRQAARMTAALLAPLPRVRAIFQQRGLRVVVIGEHQAFGDIPENGPETAADPQRFASKRADGAFSPGAAGPLDPVVSDGEENVLCYERDGYAHASNNLVHELAHNIKTHGLEVLDHDFFDRVEASFDAAIAAGKYRHLYAGTSPEEYWAEGVQDYFGVHGVYSNDINTREDLAAYDPTLFGIIDGVFHDASLPAACPPAKFTHGERYRIQNVSLGAGQALDATFLHPSGNYSGQRWAITAMAGGCFALTNEYQPGLALDVTQMRPSGNSSGQCWFFSPVTNGQWRLSNAYLGPGRSLAVESGSITTAQTQDTADQLWTVTPF
jgi:hypothetical protein